MGLFNFFRSRAYKKAKRLGVAGRLMVKYDDYQDDLIRLYSKLGDSCYGNYPAICGDIPPGDSISIGKDARAQEIKRIKLVSEIDWKHEIWLFYATLKYGLAPDETIQKIQEESPQEPVQEEPASTELAVIVSDAPQYTAPAPDTTPPSTDSAPESPQPKGKFKIDF